MVWEAAELAAPDRRPPSPRAPGVRLAALAEQLSDGLGDHELFASRHRDDAELAQEAQPACHLFAHVGPVLLDAAREREDAEPAEAIAICATAAAIRYV